MRWRRPGSKLARSPTKRRRTPLPCNSSTSLSSARTNNSINAPTSSCGRCQFSLEKAKRVSTLTSWRRQPSTTSRTALRPALWPKVRGRWRSFAQRPLPSITMAMWRGIRAESALVMVQGRWRSERHQLLFLGLDDAVDVLDEAVGELLDLVLGLALVVLGDQLFLEQVFHLLHGVATHVADSDLGVLAF